jgi:hypothetical protein
VATGRAKALRDAAPEAWVELSTRDAGRLGIRAGDLVRVQSPRGAVEARARIGDGREGVVFLPFHYGYWDAADGRPRAANELTIAAWDPVSKQPLYKLSAVRVSKVEGWAMHLATYLGLLHTSLGTLADAFREVGRGHRDEPDVFHTCQVLARRIDEQVDALAPIVDRYGEQREQEPERLHAAELTETRGGAVGLLRDLQDLYLLAALTDLTWTVVEQAAPQALTAAS